MNNLVNVSQVANLPRFYKVICSLVSTVNFGDGIELRLQNQNEKIFVRNYNAIQHRNDFVFRLSFQMKLMPEVSSEHECHLFATHDQAVATDLLSLF